MRRKTVLKGLMACCVLATSIVVASASPAHAASDGAWVEGGNCPYYFVCVYEHSADEGYGRGVAFSICRTAYLTNYRNGALNNRVSSIINNQTQGTVSFFFDRSGGISGDLPQHAYGYRNNLQYDYDNLPGGQNWNDRIDSLFVC